MRNVRVLTDPKSMSFTARSNMSFNTTVQVTICTLPSFLAGSKSWLWNNIKSHIYLYKYNLWNYSEENSLLWCAEKIKAPHKHCPNSPFDIFLLPAGHIVTSHKAVESRVSIVFWACSPPGVCERKRLVKILIKQKLNFLQLLCLSGRNREQFNTRVTPSLLYRVVLTEGR